MAAVTICSNNQETLTFRAHVHRCTGQRVTNSLPEDPKFAKGQVGGLLAT